MTIKLPKYVSGFEDRHGKIRLRFRRAGISRYFENAYGTKEFTAEYEHYLSGDIGNRATARSIIPRSIDDLVRQYYSSNDFGGNPDTKARNRTIIGRFQALHGHRPVATCPFEKLDAYIASVAVKQPNGKGGPGAAQKARKQLKRLFRYAVKIGWINKNPVDFVEPIKTNSTGFHTWTEREIEQYRAYHKLGTQARLALEIYLWTGKRRGDGIGLGRQHVHGDYLRGRDEKTKKPWRIKMAPALKEAIAAMPENNQMSFIVTAYGLPFSKKGFGNRFRKWCDEAGLHHCTAHGLRKAIMRRMAQLGVNQPGMKSISLHSDDREVATYTAQANQERLADDAIDRLVEGENWLTQINGLDSKDDKSVAI